MVSPIIPDMSFSGEISAAYRKADTPPELAGPKTTGRFLATGALTRGHFGLFQWDMAPQAGGTVRQRTRVDAHPVRAGAAA
jgi:hypothetical protein